MADQDNDPRPKWEYKVFKIDGDITAGMNLAGNEGWEVFDVLQSIPEQESPTGQPMAFVAAKRRKWLVGLVT